MEKKNLILLGVLGALILIFCAGMAMDASVETPEKIINKNLMSTADVGTTYNITIDASIVSTNIKIIGFDYIERGGIESFELEEGSYSLNSNPGARLPEFNIEASGIISYDPEYEGTVFFGMGTTKLTVIGHPITIDPTGVFFPLKIYNLEFISTEFPTIYNIPSDTQLPFVFFSQYNGFLENTTFRVTKDGNVIYDSVFDGKNLNGLGTSTLEIIGYPITIDPTGVSIQLKIYNHQYMSQDVPTVYNLPPDTHHPFAIFSPHNGYLDNASFKVTKDGNVIYDSVFDGKTLNGLGTSTLEIIGHPITIDSTGVSIQLKIYNLVDFMSQDVPTVFYLPSDTHYPFALFSSHNGYLANASFKVAKDGTVIYDSAFDGKTLNGLGTATLGVIGNSVIIDTSDAAGNIALYGFEYISAGGTETYYLPPDTIYPYVLVSNIYGGLSETFTVNKDGTVNPTEIIFDGGVVRIYSDITPPITTISLSGTEGTNGWYISDVQVSLVASDGATGIDKTEYSFDGFNWIAYSGTFSITAEGIKTVYYRSIDGAGNVEITKVIDIKVDKTQPITQIEISSFYEDSMGDIYVTSSTEFSLTASDLTSGGETIYYRINGGAWCEYSSVFTLNSNGLYTIEYYSVDAAGNEEMVNTITTNLVNFEVNSYLSKGEENSITYFDVIFTKSKQTGEYKLVATNPGQIFHITEFMNNWHTNIEALTIEVIIPDDFILKGSEPIHIYLDGIDITSDCIINGNLITLQNIPSGVVIKVVIHLDYELKGTIYANIDDFGMIGYVFETSVSGISGVNGLEQSSQVSATLITHQKKTTAIAGYVYNTNGEFLEGLTVKLYQNGVLIRTTTTDENGFYYFIDIEEGDYEVHMLYDESTEIQVATASKNELEEVNFVLAYDPS